MEQQGVLMEQQGSQHKLVLGDIENLRYRYNMRKISRYNNIHDISCMIQKSFVYITSPLLIYILVFKINNITKFTKIYIQWLCIEFSANIRLSKIFTKHPYTN